MDRRQFILTATAVTTTTLAGCIGSSTSLDTELEDGETESIEFDEGDELTIDVDPEEPVDVHFRYDVETSSEELEDEEDVSAIIGGLSEEPLVDEHIEGEETFEVDIDEDGYYQIGVDGAAAAVTID